MKAIPIVAVLADRYRYKPRKLLKAAYKQLCAAQSDYRQRLNALERRIAELHHAEDDLKAYKTVGMTMHDILCEVRNDAQFKSLTKATYEEVEGCFEDLERKKT